MSNFKLKTMKTKTIKLLALLFISSLAFTSCSEDDHDHDDHDHDHEHEEVNKLVYELTNGSDVVTLTFFDEDGEGGADGVYTVSGPLKANTTYTGKLQLLHEHEDGDIDNVGEEIAEEESDEHEIFYVTDIAGTSFMVTDVDENQNPLGFDTTVTTGAAGTGSISIFVIHEGKKPNDGTVSDAISGGGTTDLEVSFTNVVIQ